MNKKLLILSVFAAFFAAGAFAPRYFLPPEVVVVTAKQGKAVEAVYATGTVEPTILVPIAPRNGGHITEIAASEGQTVKKGDILARLEDNEQQAAIADLTARLSFAQNDLRRKQSLLNIQSISKESVDAAKADVNSLTAQIQKAKAQAGYSTLMAPADGLIIKQDGEVGEFAPAGQAIFYLSCCAPLRITAEVDEEDIPRVKVGQSVLIQTDAFEGDVFKGKIASITPKGDPVSRSYRVRVALDDAAKNPLMIGMTTETNILVKEADNALLIPITALQKDNKVQVITGNIIHIITVTTGIRDRDSVEILTGLKNGDNIVMPYTPDLKDGDTIRTRMGQKGTE